MKRVLLLLLLLPLPGRANLPREIGQKTMPGVAFVLAADFKGGKLVPISSGSGTILTADGAVLTNYHVVADKEKKRVRDVVAIGLLKAYDQSPEITCIALPKHGILDPDLDLAVVKCEADLQGKPMRVRGWPTIPIGKSSDLVPGSSELSIMGYPGVGGPTIHVTRGTVSGFLGKEGGPGRFWIKTDASIAHGNSGGSAVDDDGLLVGIPTAVAAPSGEARVGLVRPVELARPIIDQALAGWDPATAASAPGAETPIARPPAAPEDTTCALKTGVLIKGKVMASDNRDPVEGAFVVVLKPGVKRSEVSPDYKNIDTLFYTYALTDHEGAFRTTCPLPRDQSFTVVVLAKGFIELSADGILNTTGAPDEFTPWGGKIYLQRQ
ncbi:MAG TPA: serine protease [Haliangiales bacterium]|nr:serine protease [Haliangiales bacterium]